GAQVVGPGHGPLGEASVLEDQQTFFKELIRVVKAASAGKSAAEVQASVEKMKTELAANTKIVRYVGGDFAAQAGKVYNELTGQSSPAGRAAADAERRHVASHHGDAGDGE